MAIERPVGFNELHRRLIRLHLESQPPGAATAVEAPLASLDVSRLLSGASILALSEEGADRSDAHDTATRLVELLGGANPNIVAAADLILSRIGNPPGRGLLRDRYCSNDAAVPNYEGPAVPLRLHSERMALEAENMIESGEDQVTTLMDFQYKLMAFLGRHRSVSVSAPTSAGKSFIMGLDLVRRLRKTPGSCVIYVVPTRALIREVSLSVRRPLAKSGLRDVPIRRVAFPFEREKESNGTHRQAGRTDLQALQVRRLVIAQALPAGDVGRLNQEDAMSVTFTPRGAERIKRAVTKVLPRTEAATARPVPAPRVASGRSSQASARTACGTRS